MKTSLRLSKGKKSFFLPVLLLLLFSFTIKAQQLAFPTAEGGGRFAKGGRGGTVYEVTNLNDSGAGSLRDAISQPNRTIIFKVSGEIKLKSRLQIKQNNITIAGQTAPGQGICITGYTVNISASDVIVRYLRCRFGDDNAVDDDAMNSWNHLFENIIVDHCSMSWSIDETGSFYGIRNFTLQWCILSESLFNSKHDKGKHGYGGIWGGANATFHHNLLAHHTSRNPRFGGTRPGYIPYDASEELVDYRNNVLYNWGNINSSYGGEGSRINMVNNYYKPGPATPGNLTVSSSSNKRNRLLNYSNFVVDNGTDTTWGGKFYIDGNVVAGYPDVSADNWTKGVQKDSYARADELIKAARQSVPFATAPLRTQTAEQAYLTVLDSAGAILPRRDAVDARIIRETKNGTATYEGAGYSTVKDAGVTHPSGIIDSPENVGGVPKYGSNTPYKDTDKDGMDDLWETANGLNPNNASDGNTIAPNGYTNLENFLNGINKDTGTGEIAGGSVIIDLMGYDAVVAKDGTGSFKTIQAAIDAAPVNASQAYRIFIKNGKYLEKVSIVANKTFIHLIGESAAKTIISWNDYSGKVNPAGGTFGTSTSATLTIKAADCYLQNLTVENTTGDAPQALAISLEGDRNVAKSCIFLGGQDTVLSNGDGKRQYFKDCYIDGVVDFIFGSAITVFDSCVVYAKDRGDKLAGSYITAANTPTTQTYGYIFRNCILPSNTGVTSYVLGRPWQNDASTADVAKKGNKVVFLNSIYGNKIVKPEGWSTWDTGTNTSIITYAEYKNKRYDGSLADISKRVTWSKQLSDADALAYYDNTKVFGTWNPCATTTDFCTPSKAEIAFVNIKVTKGANLSTPTTFTWNIAWSMKDLRYELYRSTDNKATFSKLTETVSASDTIINFKMTDAAPAAGKTYYYLLKGIKTGLKDYISDTLTVSSVPTITIVGTPKDFIQGLGKASAAQVYSLSAENLADKLMITIPNNFEISANAGKTWMNSSSNFSLTPTNGSIATTSIQVRLNSTQAGTFSGNILHTSTDAISKSITVNGTTQTDPLPVSQRLAFWSMIVADNDSSALRAKGVIVPKPILKRLSLSNNSVIPAYSALHGQAFAPSTDGGGLWTTAGGGFGNNLNRGLYEQFVIKASSGYAVKVDSISLKMALYAAATGKFAIVYSKTGFKTDSADVSGGLMSGIPMPNTANGAFATPALPVSEPSETATFYQLALNGANGINLATGDSITIRMYFSTGSSSAGRYAKIKDLSILGSIKDLNAVKPVVLNVSQSLSDFTFMAGTNSPIQTYSITGENLTQDLSITAPINFEISKDGITWFGSNTSLKLTASAGKIAQTTIYVRVNTANAGNYSGNISHVTEGLTTITLAVKAILTASAPTLNISQNLQDFVYLIGGVPANTQTYNLSGDNLLGEIILTPPPHFEISLDNTTWVNAASSLKLTSTSGKLSQTSIAVRMTAKLIGNFTGNITHKSSGMSEKLLVLKGSVSAPLAVEEEPVNKISIGPNPAQQSLKVSHPTGKASLSILGTGGQKIQQIETQLYSTFTIVNLEHLSSGQYFIEYLTDKHREVLKFIKN
ncbi:pectinesterase family protein [Arcicella lustrica]|uniref:Pectinesterase family protein n=1 Tax=Arcicella lustrica TaxID=2984196 RepID=A0ABU5SG08_9BACT|nr:pectinesterase family protein [Arcicella sp. DC25W]MEA5426195.1 pectinesterase family protein [Arcicella sp. DC25W]